MIYDVLCTYWIQQLVTNGPSIGAYATQVILVVLKQALPYVYVILINERYGHVYYDSDADVVPDVL